MKKAISMLKNSRLAVSISLLIQAFTLFVLFLILCAKKKSIAAAFLGVAAMEGAAGAYLFLQAKEDLEENDFDPSDYLDETLDIDEEEELELNDEMLTADLYHRMDDEGDAPEKKEIPLEEEVDEEEFKNS